MSTGPAIREAGADDAETVVGLYEWLFAAARDPSRPAGTARRASSGSATRDRLPTTPPCSLAEHNGEPVGICSVYIDLRSVRFGERAWIEDLAVDPGRRSQRIGEALMEAAFDWARRREASHLELDSGDARPDAHRFYERLEPSWSGRQFSWWLG